MPAPLAYRRILLKLSGEALMGAEDYGIDPTVITRIAREIIEAREAGAEVGLVIGGGNIFRGAGLAVAGHYYSERQDMPVMRAAQPRPFTSVPTCSPRRMRIRLPGTDRS